MEATVETIESPYGYCPQCGAKGARRERRPNGDDTCEKGHTYPSRNAVLERTISMRVREVFRRIIPIVFFAIILFGCYGCDCCPSKVQQRQMVVEDAKTIDVFDMRNLEPEGNAYFVAKKTDGSVWVYYPRSFNLEKTMIFPANK